MTRPLAILCLALAACSDTYVTDVYVSDDAASDETAPDAADGATAPDAGPDVVADTGAPDTGWRVRCQLRDGGDVYEGCNGVYAKRLARVSWTDGYTSGDCWPASEDAGSPPANCIPDVGRCTVFVPGGKYQPGDCI